MMRLRPGEAALPDQPWDDNLRIDEQGVGLDSLERLTIAAALSEALHLHESGVEDLLLARRGFGQWQQVVRHGLKHFDSQLTFRTSGTSGRPKSCSHLLAELRQEVIFLAGLLPGVKRVLTAVPSHHIYGFLWTVLLPSRLGCRKVIDVRQLTPQALQRTLRAGDLIISHPVHWSLMTRHAIPFPLDVIGVSSTADCPAKVARDLVKNGLSRLLQVYGSSERGGIGWREHSASRFQLMPFWSRDASGHHRLVRLTPSGERRSDELQDHLAWYGDRSFRVRARRDQAVQVAGNNVHLNHVRRVLMQHPQVADAAVRLMTPSEGTRLKAYIVPTPHAEPTDLRADLTRWANTRLAASERPRSFTVGVRIPRNERGKLTDWQLSAKREASSRT